MKPSNLEVMPIPPGDAQVIRLIEALDELQEGLYPTDSNHLDSTEELAQPNVRFLGALEGDLLLGCGGVKLMDDEVEGIRYGEIKRMFVAPHARGKGVARRLMAALEVAALAGDAQVMRLETGIYQPDAIRLYERYGFESRGPFGQYAPDALSVFMEKRLAP